MLEENIEGELFPFRFLIECTFNEEYRLYGSKLMRPLFKKDEQWYLVSVYSKEHGWPEDIYNPKFSFNERLIKYGSSEAKSKLDGYQYAPLFFSLAKEQELEISEYLGYLCSKYFEPRINEEVICNVRYDNKNSTVYFEIPFVSITPSIHINAVLYNWDTAEQFIKDMIVGLKKLIPSKVEGLFAEEKHE